MVRYHIEPRKGTALPLSAEDLAADLAVAEQLLDSPPEYSPGGPWDAPAAVAATALEASIISGTELPAEALRFAAETVIRIGEGAVEPHPYDNEGSYFEQGADRSAARVLPLLLLPGAAALRASLDGGDGSEAYARAAAAAGSIARSLANEVRVHLARGLDRVWEAPCRKDGDVPSRHGVPARRRDDARLRLRAVEPGHRQAPAHRACRPCRPDARGHRGQRDPLLPPGRGDPGARPGRPGRRLRLRPRPGTAHGAARRTPALPALLRR